MGRTTSARRPLPMVAAFGACMVAACLMGTLAYAGEAGMDVTSEVVPAEPMRVEQTADETVDGDDAGASADGSALAEEPGADGEVVAVDDDGAVADGQGTSSQPAEASGTVSQPCDDAGDADGMVGSPASAGEQQDTQPQPASTAVPDGESDGDSAARVGLQSAQQPASLSVSQAVASEPSQGASGDAGGQLAQQQDTQPQKVAKGTVVDVPEGTYVIRLGVGGAQVLDVRDGKRTTISANAQTKKAAGTASQLWDIILSDRPGWYYICAHGTNCAIVLDVTDGKAQSKANVRLWECNGSNAQLWQFVTAIACLPGDLSSLSIVSRLGSQLLIDVSGGKAANGTNVRIYKGNGSRAQTVSLVRQAKYGGRPKPTKGVWAYKPSSKATITYWFDAKGNKAKSRVVQPGEGAGGYYYATGSGAIAKRAATLVGTTVYLSKADGRLVDLPKGKSRGWVDGNLIGNGKRRYYLYRQGGKAYSVARFGYSTDGYPHYTCSKGHVATGRWTDGKNIYLASSSGRMLALSGGTGRGWLNANYVQGHGERRYYLYRNTANGRFKGACYAREGFSRDGGFHYTRWSGFVLQGGSMGTWAGTCSANRNGIITTNLNTVDHAWAVLEHIAKNRSKYQKRVYRYDYGNGCRGTLYIMNPVDVSVLGISASTMQRAFDTTSVCSEWVNNIDTKRLKSKNGKTTTVSLVFNKSQAEVAKRQKRLDQATSWAIRKAKTIRDAGKRATFLHDWLCSKARYDNSHKVYDGYGLLTGGKGVCAAYSKAYAYLCNQSGLRCEYVSGRVPAGNHAWNRLWIGGRWLHTDVTWDDGGYGHYYNLRTLTWFNSHKHWLR